MLIEHIGRYFNTLNNAHISYRKGNEGASLGGLIEKRGHVLNLVIPFKTDLIAILQTYPEPA
jgi:hypothetical protein